MDNENFYRDFEERYRGSQELVKSRLSVYLLFVLPLRRFCQPFEGIDLGCGRGEWLEIMKENGINILGVDLNDGMLKSARERGLSVLKEDAVKSLQKLSGESQSLVTGYHIAEHLTFDSLQNLIRESMRVLRPGGMLILETPNPENITVGTERFYLDPTHIHPLPSQLLCYLAEYAGFKKVKVIRLQEELNQDSQSAIDLYSVLSGVSPDYAVIAQKNGSPEILDVTASAFEKEYGLSLEMLAKMYDSKLKESIQQIGAQYAEATAKMYTNSMSWRLTKPLREIKRIIGF